MMDGPTSGTTKKIVHNFAAKSLSITYNLMMSTPEL